MKPIIYNILTTVFLVACWLAVTVPLSLSANTAYNDNSILIAVLITLLILIYTIATGYLGYSMYQRQRVDYELVEP